MWIKNLFLEDFGCFRHQRLEGLSPHINVLAGPQRSGKTTFMQILRYLGFSLPSNGSIPPPNDPEAGYRVDADVEVDGTEYLIKRKGSLMPSVRSEDDEEISIEDLYGSLSPFRYRQIFTITLDELRRIPENLGDREEVELQSALLGGGWADVVRMPQIEEEFASTANQIGGKYGRAVAKLKPYVEQIRKGMEQREEARRQVQRYQDVIDRIRQLEEEINHQQQQRRELEKRQDRLAIVGEWYDEFATFLEKESLLTKDRSQQLLDRYPENGRERARQLKQQWEQVHDRFREARRHWDRANESHESFEVDRERLWERRHEVESYRDELSGLRERIRQLEERREELREAEHRFRNQAREIHKPWSENPEQLGDVDLGMVEKDRLDQAASRCAETEKELQNVKTQWERTQDELKNLRQTLEELPPVHLPRWLALTVLSLGMAAVGGGLAVLYEPRWAGLSISAGGVLAGAIFLYLVMTRWERRQEQRDLRQACRQRETEVEQLETRRKQLQTSLNEAREELGSLQSRLGLPEDLSPGTTAQYYRDVQDCKRLWEEIRTKRRTLENREEELREECRTLAELIAAISDQTVPDEPLDGAGDLFRQCGQILEQCELLEELMEARQRRETVLEDGLSLLQRAGFDIEAEAVREDDEPLRDALHQMMEDGRRVEELREAREQRDRIRLQLRGRLESESSREAFREFCEDTEQEGWELEGFRAVWNQFSSREDLQDQRTDVESRIATIRQELEEKRDQISDLKRERDELGTDEKLVEAQQTIEEGRSRLEPQAEEYAVNRIAQQLAHRLYRRFVRKTYSGLLDEASEIFRRMTGDDYVKIAPFEEDLRKADFRAVMSNGENQQTGELSRGTREQLFLAIRLARIQDIEPPLPVILDDSAVNFDPAHRRRVSEIIGELCHTHQVFLLTSHPEMVMSVGEHAREPAYWCIRPDHHVEGSYQQPDPLVELLRENQRAGSGASTEE